MGTARHLSDVSKERDVSILRVKETKKNVALGLLYHIYHSTHRNSTENFDLGVICSSENMAVTTRLYGVISPP